MYWVTGILGVMLVLAPFVFGYIGNIIASLTSYSIGVVVAVVSFVEGYTHDRDAWEYWTAALLGIAAVLAPFVLGFSTHVIAMWTSVALGGLLTIIAGSRLYMRGLR